jgi:hypothetical protein
VQAEHNNESGDRRLWPHPTLRRNIAGHARDDQRGIHAGHVDDTPTGSRRDHCTGGGATGEESPQQVGFDHTHVLGLWRPLGQQQNAQPM